MARRASRFFPGSANERRRRTMKRFWILSLIGLVLSVSVVWSQSAKASKTEQAVAALEQQWLQAQKSNNPDLIVPLLADNFVDTSSEGKFTDGPGMLATEKATKYDSAEYYDVKVHVYGNTAVATGEFKSKGTDDAGKRFTADERWTDTWVKMPNGKWQCVASQGTPVKI
jgi:ketosteroid isomerase-like protein